MRENIATCAPGNAIDVCEILVRAATPDLYRSNAFRVLELPVDATAREVARRGEMLKMAEKYGNSVPREPAPLPLDPPADETAVTVALHSLRDPERRLVDEFFWFWPAQLGQSKRDPNLIALAAGRVQAAFNAWHDAERSSSESNVSMHNIAVLTHALALDQELSASQSNGLTEKQLEQRDRAWSYAFRRWKILLGYEPFWNLFQECNPASPREAASAPLAAGQLRRHDLVPHPHRLLPSGKAT
jgi:hypothetical protein